MSIKNQNIKTLSLKNQNKHHHNSSNKNNIVFEENNESSNYSYESDLSSSLLIEYSETISENDFVQSNINNHNKLYQKRFNHLMLDIKHLSTIDKLKLKYLY